VRDAGAVDRRRLQCARASHLRCVAPDTLLPRGRNFCADAPRIGPA
jgi:hypothetical protein